MKYIGRIIAVIGILIQTIVLIIRRYLMDGVLNLDRIKSGLVISFIFGIFYWWVGKCYDKLKFYSSKDPLTEVYNRRFIYKNFFKPSTKQSRKNKQFGISIIDVNNFKQINDTFGHQKGDLVLKEIAHTLVKNTRKGDIVARWGGDEFLIIIFELDKASSLSMISRIEEKLKEVSKRIGINISISIGTSFYLHDGETLDKLIKVADDKMYENKRKRERVNKEVVQNLP